MKKIFAVILVLALALSLASCGKKEEDSKTITVGATPSPHAEILEVCKEILAEQFGVSERTAAMEINIGNHLISEGMDLYDEGGITKKAADAIARLPEKRQQELVQQISSGEVTKDAAEEVARGRQRTSTRVPKTSDDLLIEARRALKRALVLQEPPDRVKIAELRNLLDKLDPDNPTETE